MRSNLNTKAEGRAERATAARRRRPAGARGLRLARGSRPWAAGTHEGKIHRVDPDSGSTLTVSNRDSQSDCWVNWKIMGQPCEFQAMAACAF
jgi:hypothetical protein